MLDVGSGETVIVREVGPRDGLQSLEVDPSVEDRVAVVRDLSSAGVRRIEVGAFVSPKAVPQMRRTKDVLARLPDDPGVRYEVLVPNEKGAELALTAGARSLTVVIAASVTFNQRNVGRTVERSLAELQNIVALAQAAGARCSVDVATAFGCAYEGPVMASAVVRLVRQIRDLGVDEVVLCDTIGAAAPNDVAEVFGAARRCLGPQVPLGLHFHNTRGLGLANVIAGLDAGCRLFDASIGGLGGCPFSPGASGNIATEDLVHMLDCLGLPSGIDVGVLISAARWFQQSLGVPFSGQVMKAGPRFATESLRGTHAVG